MTGSDTARTWSVRIALLAGGALALARFIRYIDVVTDTDVEFTASLAWWGTYAAGLALVSIGAIEHVTDESDENLVAWASLLVGLLILVVMPSSPAPAFEFGQAMGSMFGP